MILNSNKKLFSIALYLILLLISIIAALIGFLGITNAQTLQSFILNISTELLGTSIIFFIFMFFSAEDNNKENEIYCSSISDELSCMSKNINLILKSTDSNYIVDINQQIVSLQTSVNHLSVEFNKLGKRVSEEFSNRQNDLMETLQNQFKIHIENSGNALDMALSKELIKILPSVNDQSLIRELLKEQIGHAIYTMAQYQSVILEREIKESLEIANQKVIESVKNVSSEVMQVQSNIDNLQALLPSSYNESNQKPDLK